MIFQMILERKQRVWRVRSASILDYPYTIRLRRVCQPDGKGFTSWTFDCHSAREQETTGDEEMLYRLARKPRSPWTSDHIDHVWLDKKSADEACARLNKIGPCQFYVVRMPGVEIIPEK